jgi:hypothetical protein
MTPIVRFGRGIWPAGNLVYLVCLVYLVHLVDLVCFVDLVHLVGRSIEFA